MPTELFNPIPIYYSDISEEQFLRIKEEIDKNIKNEIYSMSSWGDFVKTTLDLYPNIVTQLNLVETEILITTHMKKFLKDIKIQKNFYISNSWFNKLSKYGHQGLHTHSPSDDMGSNKIYSGVYFYEKLQNDHEPISFRLKNNVYNVDIRHNYVPGRIILFSGLIPHLVKFNKFDEDRTSLSFNVVLV